MTQKETPTQFINVARGTISGATISGTYNQTTGPIVNPNMMVNTTIKPNAPYRKF